MIRIPFLLLALAALSGCSVTFGPAAPPQVVAPPAEVALREGVALPAPVTVAVNGGSYPVTLIRGGGSHPYPQPGGGVRHADVVLVGGTGDKLAAVDAYLAHCYPGRPREATWGDEYIPRRSGGGEWIFEYPEGCPARGSAPVA